MLPIEDSKALTALALANPHPSSIESPNRQETDGGVNRPAKTGSSQYTGGRIGSGPQGSLIRCRRGRNADRHPGRADRAIAKNVFRDAPLCRSD
jgi:hypothetical protein